MVQDAFRFDGPNPKRDHDRLTAQIKRIYSLMSDRSFRTLGQIADLTNDPESSISAQLRHLRKEKFGSNTVNKKYMGNGLYKYQLVPSGKFDQVFTNGN